MTIDHGAMQALIELLDNTFENLGVRIDLHQVESMATVVHNAMNVQARNYHNLEHVFNFKDPTDPLVHIAALFHDIVYYQVDLGFHSDLEPLIRSYIVEENGDFRLADRDFQEDHLYRLALAVFNFKPAQIITVFSGLNEFLSAMVMLKMLGAFLPHKELLMATVCIEATIPFRGVDEHGRWHFEVLEERLFLIRPWCGFSYTKEEIETTLRRAVLFSNKDVETFAEPNVARFLDITWKLLPETNAALRARGIYTIRDYRLAIQKMEIFLSGLNPDHVFNSYKDTPPPDVYETMRQRSHNNVATATRYLRIKLLAMGLLEAIAEYSGGDAPISLFIGDIPIVGVKTRHLDDFLPEVPIPDHIHPEDDEIYKLLETGRDSETFFDLKNSPLSLFVYKSLALAQLESLYVDSVLLFKGMMNPKQYLARVPRPLLTSVARGCAIMAYTRRESLMQLVNEA